MYTSQRQESRRKGYGIYTTSYNNKYEEDDEETKVLFFYTDKVGFDAN